MRLALVTAAVAVLLAAPALAAADKLIVTHMGVPLIQPLGVGDIVVGIAFWDGTRMQAIDGVTIQMPASLPSICGPSLGPARPLG